ncbi:MAG: vWA domain-containing protein [Hyphomicrobiales bacterium]
MNTPSTAGHAKPAGGKLAENIMHFARILRQAGLPVGTAQVIDAISAAESGCLGNRDDFYWMLHALFVRRREHRAVFDQAFHVFWQKPKMLEQLMSMFFQEVARPAGEHKKKAGERRLSSAMFEGPDVQSTRRPPKELLEIDASYTFNADEVLRDKDFEQMFSEEQADAMRAIALMRVGRFRAPTRRFGPASKGNVDMRRTLKAAARSGAGGDILKFRTRRLKEPPLVVLCDISGSMSGYSRMFVHFLHAMKSDRSRMHVFLFGTRLTNITRALERRDVDEAVEEVTNQVKDWSGGTRIGACLREFNFKWSRRVLAQGAHVLLITDGLERDDDGVLEKEISRLKRSTKRLTWLNPLLRYDGFEARAGGIRTMLAHVDEFRPVHNLNSLEELARTLTATHARSNTSNPRHWLAQGEAV